MVNHIESLQSQLFTFAGLHIHRGSLTGDQLSIPEGPFKLAGLVVLVLIAVTAGDGGWCRQTHIKTRRRNRF